MTITFEGVMNLIRIEARRVAKRENLPLYDAYLQAIVNTIMTVAEERAIEPFEATLLDALAKAQAKRGGAVLASDIRIELELMGISRVDRWTIWNTLSNLEARHLTYRPGGDDSRKWACRPQDDP